MKKLMHILLLSCLRATELIEKKLHFKLSVQEKLQLRMHKMMCSACSNYEKQSVFIEKGISISQKREFTIDDIEQLKLTITEKLSETK
jgi:hypothetical protein